MLLSNGLTACKTDSIRGVFSVGLNKYNCVLALAIRSDWIDYAIINSGSGAVRFREYNTLDTISVVEVSLASTIAAQ